MSWKLIGSIEAKGKTHRKASRDEKSCTYISFGGQSGPIFLNANTYPYKPFGCKSEVNSLFTLSDLWISQIDIFYF